MNAVTIAIAFVVGIVIGVDFACLFQRRSRIGHFAEGFRTERQGIESQWDRSDDISTEDPRCSFRHHRSTFERLLSI